MKIQKKTLETLAHIIIGGDDKKAVQYRDIEDLVKFFKKFGLKGFYHSNLPSRLDYTKEKLYELNDSDKMIRVVQEAIDPEHYKQESTDSNEAAALLEKDLIKDGYKIDEEHRINRNIPDDVIEQASWGVWDFDHENYPEYHQRYYKIYPLEEKTIDIENELMSSLDFILEQINKATERRQQGDYDGAITIAYTLIEDMIKHLLQENQVEFKETGGDIRSLYNQLSDALNLNPRGESIENHTKSILEGFRKQVGGFYYLANKASDRHSKKYKPSRHHAKLAVNAALVLCEFLLESHEYQKSKKQN